jgi:PAS domain S-box-containing protein
MMNQEQTETSLLQYIAELETLIAKSNDRFSQFSISTGIWIWEVNRDGLFTYVSQMAKSLLGYTEEELIGKKYFYDLYDPEIKDNLKNQAFEVFFEKGSFKNFESQNIHRNGQIITLETNGSPIFDNNGNFIGYRCANRDITQSKRVLNNLHKLNRLYAVISHVNRAITEIKDKKKLYEEICRATVKYGNFRMAWIGLVNEETQTIKPFVHAGFEEGYLSVIKPISVIDLPEGRGPSGSAIREGRHFICSDFETDPLVAPWRFEALRRGYRSSIALPIKQSGKVIGAFTIYAPSPCFFDEPEVELLLEVACDISFAIDTIELEQHHEQTVRELVGSEQKYRMLTENMRDVVWIADAQTLRFTYLGPSIEKLLGYKAEELIGKPLDTNQVVGNGGDISSLFKDRYIVFNNGAQDTEIEYYTDDVALLRNDGCLVNTEITTYFRLNPSNRRAEVHGLTRDISERKLLEEHELATKNRFAEIFESITDGFIAFDSKMNYTFLNKRGAALLGYQPADLLGKNYWTEFPEAKGTPFANAYLQVLESRTPYNFDNYYAPWDRWFENRIYPTPDGIAVYFSETTERKRAEKLIVETTEKLKRAQHLANVGSWEANIDTGQMICSEEMYRIMGYTVGIDIKIEDITNRFAPGELDRFTTNLLKSRENGINHKAIYRIIRTDGNERYIHHEDEMQRDDLGRAKWIFGTSQDITDRILAEEEILQTKKQFQAMFEHSPMGISLVETQTGKIIEANLMFSTITGRKPEELNSLDWMTITHPDDLSTGMAKMELLKGKKIQGYKMVKRYYKPDGTIVWVNLTVAAIQNVGNIATRHLAMIEDITEKKQLLDDLVKAKEKAEESDLLKTAFINNISHEIRTPLNGIIGFADLISQPDITQEERFEYLSVLQQSTDRLIQTVTDYMDISKIVTGNMDVNKIDFDLDGLFDDLLYQTKNLCTKKNIDINIAVPQSDNKLVITSDRLLLAKAMGHLLSNAVKFTSQGSITFGYLKVGDQLEFFVGDTGKGIAKNKLKTIFNAYTQEDASITRGYEGSGLGLAIVNGIANLLDGKTWAESEKGNGAKFYFSIPCSTSFSEWKFKPSPNLPITRDILKTHLILIAEDSETHYTSLQYMLGRAGMETIHARNGTQAVDLCKQNDEISLILMDIKMPFMDGIEATRLIKQFRVDLPIIAITAFAQTVEENLMRDAGCCDILAKPIRKEELLMKISKYI